LESVREEEGKAGEEDEVGLLMVCFLSNLEV
jgi:hypothetical protein